MLRKNKISRIFGIGLCCLFFLGCSNESFVLEQENYELASEMPKEMQRDERTVEKELSEETQKETTEVSQGKEQMQEEVIEIAVHICGEVNQPGVYIFQQKARIYDGIQKAGGFTPEAVKDYLNLALVLEDGMKIEVPSEEMVKEWEEKNSEEETGISYGSTKNSEGKSADGKINLNTAGEEELCTLPGIGESRARSIISYREENGGFQRIEDIMNIPGIKEAAFEKIKEYVTVSK